MKSEWFTCLVVLGLGALWVHADESDNLLQAENDALRLKLNNLTNAQWNHDSDINDQNKEILIQVNNDYDEFRKGQYKKLQDYDYSGLEPFKKRQFEKLAVIGLSALNEEDSQQFKSAQLDMESIYSSATIELDGKPGQSLEPDLTQLLATSRNESLLRDAWILWRDATGKKMRQNYTTYYTLGNKAAKLNKIPGKEFNHLDDLWMFSWESTDLKGQVARLMEELKPLYQKIHAYVRYHLTEVYGKEVMPSDGTIPAHLLGNMWAQQWGNLLNIIPELNFELVDPIDQKVNDNLKSWEVNQMFQLSEKFFSGLGMQKMTDTFWKKSILVKNDKVNMTCHASAWDFYEPGDFRIKQCTDKTMNDLVTVHHEMGHIQYFMNYADQPVVYREGANPGFHEAIGDLIALSVSTPQHLAKVGLLNQQEVEPILEKININYQLKMALDKIVFLPFAYVMDKWRWDVFSNPSKQQEMNKHWWRLRIEHQGISPPGKRSENDFDPGAKYHIPAGVEYVRYFVSHVLQFQFYKHLCNLAEASGELYQCDFDGNQKAGASLIAMLKKGSSQTWIEILESFIGSPNMSLDALNEYFKPLNKRLDAFLDQTKIEPGWNAQVDTYFKSSSLGLTCSLFLFLLPIVLHALLN